MHVDSTDAVAHRHEADVVSPELALVDPELGLVARALLRNPAEFEHPRPDARTIGGRAFAGWTLREPVDPVRESPSRRLLVGVAAATMLALLMFDVRGEVGERPAAADSNAFPIRVHRTTPPKPTPASANRPFAGVPAKAAPRAADRRFAWAPVQGASGYHVEFFRGATRVFAKQTTRPLLNVPAAWTFEGTKRTLRPGTYGWYVWPIVGGRRQSQAVVQTTVSILGR